MAEQVIALTASEIDALHGVGPLAFTVYVLLRQWMDYGTGTVGRTRPVSLAMIRAYTETHTRKNKGMHIEQPSERGIRTALERLIGAGLLQRLSGDRLAFRLPSALTSASVRPKKTRRTADTLNPAPALAISGIEGGNPTHIMGHVIQNLYAPAVDNFSGHGPAPHARKPRSPDGSPSNRPSHPAPRLSPTIPGTSTSTSTSHQNSLLRLGQRIGIEARPGESWQEYGHRLTQCRTSPPRATHGGMG